MSKKTEEQIQEEVDMIYTVLNRLTGKINPVGETNEDVRRLDNLKVFIGVTDKLLIDIDEVEHNNYQRYEFSMKRAAALAAKFLEKVGITNR